MPVSTPISKSDQALVSSATGALPVSQGPGAIPLYDPNLARVGGVNVTKTPEIVTGLVHQMHNVTASNPTNCPWSETYQGFVVGGKVDCVQRRGFLIDTLPVGYHQFAESWENVFQPGFTDGIHFDTHEYHKVFTSSDRSVDYRMESSSLAASNYGWYVSHATYQTTWRGRLGTVPLLDLTTNDDDTGRVRMTNSGAGNLLELKTYVAGGDGTGGGLVTLTSGSGGGLAIDNGAQATASVPLVLSPAFGLTGYRWNGSASVATSMNMQMVPTSGTQFAYKMALSGGYAWFLNESGRTGLGIPNTSLMTQNCTILNGFYAATDQVQSVSIAVAGINTANQVQIAPAGTTTVMPGITTSAASSAIAGNATVGGTLGVAGTTALGAKLTVTSPGSGTQISLGKVGAIDTLTFSYDLTVANAAEIKSSPNGPMLFLTQNNKEINFQPHGTGFSRFTSAGSGTILSLGKLGANDRFTVAYDATVIAAVELTSNAGGPVILKTASNQDIQLTPNGTGKVAAGGGGLTVGAGSALTKFLAGSATLDFGSVAAQASADLTISVTGAAVGDCVAMGLPAAPDANVGFFAWVSAANTVTVRCMNFSSGAVDPASGVYKATIFRA